MSNKNNGTNYNYLKYGQKGSSPEQDKHQYSGFVSLQQFAEGDNPYGGPSSKEKRHKKQSILEGVGRDNIMLNRVNIHAAKYNNKDKIGHDN